MERGHSKDITTLLGEANEGDARALNDLVKRIYAELRAMAAKYVQYERPGHPMQASDLVQVALLRMIDGSQLKAMTNRAMLFFAAGRAMRQILIDHARHRAARKRSGQWRRIPFDTALAAIESQRVDLESLNSALNRLNVAYPRQGQIIEMRFFAGREIGEIAELLGISRSTVEKELKAARAFLREQLTRHELP